MDGEEGSLQVHVLASWRFRLSVQEVAFVQNDLSMFENVASVHNQIFIQWVIYCKSVGLLPFIAGKSKMGWRPWHGSHCLTWSVECNKQRRAIPNCPRGSGTLFCSAIVRCEAYVLNKKWARMAEPSGGRAVPPCHAKGPVRVNFSLCQYLRYQNLPRIEEINYCLFPGIPSQPCKMKTVVAVWWSSFNQFNPTLCSFMPSGQIDPFMM